MVQNEKKNGSLANLARKANEPALLLVFIIMFIETIRVFLYTKE